jgi:hypothetical protein
VKFLIAPRKFLTTKWENRKASTPLLYTTSISSIEMNTNFIKMLIPGFLTAEQETSRLRSLISNSRSPGLFERESDFLTERLLAHPASTPLPSVELATRPPRAMPDRVVIAKRLIDAYQKACADEIDSQMRREGEDLWSDLIRRELPDLIEAIDQGDAIALADYLMNFGTSFVWFGGITTCVDGYNRNQDPQHIALTYLDKLVCLAESLGAIRYESPESGPWGQNLCLETATLIEIVEQHLGISVIPPTGIIHTDGLVAGNGLLHYRHINALYAAARLAMLNPEREAVCEIGGGLGLTAMYARRLRMKAYTIIDLPITLLLAGHYLLHALGKDEVSLYGEPPKKDSIQLLPYWEIAQIPDNTVELCLNQDSMPEIADNLIMQYLHHIKRITRNHFLSINHECFYPRTTRHFVAKSGGFKPIYRFKCWTREGYMEELYKISKPYGEHCSGASHI